jgi:hypothetical protein
VWKLHASSRLRASDAALVVTVGNDDTLLAASHHVGSTPIISQQLAHSSIGCLREP